MPEQQPFKAGTGEEKARCKDQPGDLLPEDTQANFGAKGAHRTGGRRRSFDEDPEREAPGENGDGLREFCRITRRARHPAGKERRG